MKYVPFLMLAFLLFCGTGCRKERISNNCSDLLSAMESGNVPDAGKAITWFIKKLPSEIYSKENLERLASSLSGKCSITANLLCYSCIETLPEQSEISISYNSGSGVKKKSIDISYTADNKIKFVSMHD